ncbi:MAG: hypothetical protein DHS20C21_12240 [Gemmatimonadota bacterium]|nr:MAG: hypothetical protein DHS20C21_12240 [Gemmatimonadota bacterium]
MQSKQIAAALVGIALFGAGVLVSGRIHAPDSASLLGASPAFAGDVEEIAEGATFVSTDGGAAYLWRRNGDRIELIGQCQRTEGDSEGQATFVWLPGVERRS